MQAIASPDNHLPYRSYKRTRGGQIRRCNGYNGEEDVRRNKEEEGFSEVNELNQIPEFDYLAYSSPEYGPDKAE